MTVIERHARRFRCSSKGRIEGYVTLRENPAQKLKDEIMSQARHPMPSEVAGLSLEEIAKRYVARFSDRNHKRE